MTRQSRKAPGIRRGRASKVDLEPARILKSAFEGSEWRFSVTQLREAARTSLTGDRAMLRVQGDGVKHFIWSTHPM